MEHFNINDHSKGESSYDLSKGIKQCQPFTDLQSKVKKSKKEQEYVNDVWSVQQVSVTFENLKPSPIVEKISLAKKCNHDAALENFTSELDNSHKLCATNIQQFKMNLESKINSIHLSIKNKQNNLCKIQCINCEDCKKFKDVVELMLNEETSLIDEYFKYIKSIDGKHQSDVAELFKKYYLILQKVFYLKSNDMDTLMANKITECNKISMKNKNKYDEMRLKLLSSVDEFKQNFYIWLDDVHKNRLKVCQRNALNDFHAENKILQNAGLVYLQTMEGKAAFYRLKTRKTVITETVAKWDLTIPFSINRIKEQSKQLESTILSIDSIIKNFINSYKTYVLKYVCRLLHKLKELQKIENMSEMVDENCSRAAEVIYDSGKERVEKFLLELENIGGVILMSIRDKAEGIFKIFDDFGSPWDVQSASFSKLQNAVIKQLRNRTEKNLLNHVKLQENIDKETKNLRQGNSIEQLDKKLMQVFAIVDRKSNRFKSDYEEDCRIIKKCKDTVKIEVLAMKNKIDKFLEINMPAESAENCNCSPHECNDNCSDKLHGEELILKELQLIERQTDSLDNWKSNFLMKMSSYQSWLEKDMMDIVESWENELLGEVAQSLENNIKSVEELRKNICEKVYDIRAKELLEHKNKLELHKKMITGFIQESAKCVDTFLDFTDTINNYKLAVLQMFEESGSKIKTSGQVKSLINTLTKLKNKYNNNINVKITCTSERMMKKTSLMTNYNESFIGGIVLFESGGNFTTEELNLAKKETNQLFKDIEKDKSENNLKIKKVTNKINDEIQNIENYALDSLNITMKKIKVQEDIINATRKCEYYVELKVRLLKQFNNATMNEVADFIEKCQNKLPLNELIVILNKLIRSVQDNFNFIKEPIPSINIPEDIRSSKVKLKNQKINKTQSKLPVNEKVNFINAAQNYNSNNYVSVVKYIQDALSIINDRGTNYYNVLINKTEQSSFPDKNKLCENCIHCSLQRIHDIYSIVCNCWMQETNRLLIFFQTVKMPSIEWYLLDKDSFDGNNVTNDSTKRDSNHCISAQVEENFTRFQNMLQEMSCLLQSKSPNVCESISENGN